MYRIIVVSVFLIAGLTSCRYITGKKIRGNGNVITKERTYSGFTNVKVGSALHLYVKQDSAFSVKVVTDENLQDYIEIGVEDGTLYINQEDHTRLNATGKINIYVSAPVYKQLKASGASEIYGENQLISDNAISIDVSGASYAEMNLRAPAVTAEMTGASKIRLSGQTKDLSIDGTGASIAKCFELLSENTLVDLTGASSAEVYASVKLDAGATGASSVKYKGNAANVVQNVSGAASVKKVE